MPNYSELSKEQRKRVDEQFEIKILAWMAARRKLRDRIREAALSEEQVTNILLRITEMDFTIDDLQARLNALEMSTQSIRPPSPEKLKEMRDKMAQIAKINAKNKTAKDVIATVTEFAGSIKKPGGDG